ncbi:hypothetical protein TIFTF001_033087 [Ficus carica]|uniref:Uncharacterized protein n=1 Tax=Ficus carica TaxID=3494 RepID=A0AA88DXU5_FICCA|nr:hypothetical protein TIFTF001_033087 [Ficus carica]
MTRMVVIILEPSCCGASRTISPRSINATSTTSMTCDSRVEECLIAGLDEELEIQMPYEISRRIVATNYNRLTQTAAYNPSQAAACGWNGKYRPCSPNNKTKNQETCNNPYKRAGCF